MVVQQAHRDLLERIGRCGDLREDVDGVLIVVRAQPAGQGMLKAQKLPMPGSFHAEMA
jgi:hypothetical protein